MHRGFRKVRTNRRATTLLSTETFFPPIARTAGATGSTLSFQTFNVVTVTSPTITERYVAAHPPMGYRVETDRTARTCNLVRTSMSVVTIFMPAARPAMVV